MEDQLGTTDEKPTPRVLRPGVHRGRIPRTSSRSISLPAGTGEGERWLTACELREVFTDISSKGTHVEATFKQKRTSTPEPAPKLPELFVDLIQRKSFGAQISYQYAGQSRVDTILATEKGFCCIRAELSC